MRAIRVGAFGGVEQMRLEEIAPEPPAPGQVAVEIRAAGVNPVDAYVRAGTHAVRPPLPYTPGFDGAGVVAEVGRGVAGLRSGDQVYVSGSLGTYAQLIVVDAARVHALPADLSYAQGAALGIPYITAVRALHEVGGVRPEHTVLVHGASGTVGLACVELARAIGARVIGSAGSVRGLDAVRAAGAVAVNHHAADFADTVRVATDGRGVDRIIEMLANVNLGSDLTLLASGGRVVVVGSRGTVELNPRDLMTREATIAGVFFFHATPAQLQRAQDLLDAALRAGTVRPVIAAALPLEQAGAAHELVLGAHPPGKIVLAP
jgi:NADPH2:quinone reductase